MLIGLISDTHGLIRQEALDALRGAEIILHAGDVGGGRVLRELRALAPVRAVFGNVDDPQDPDLEKSIDLEVDGVRVHVSHGHELGRPTPEKLLSAHAAHVIVYGHTHEALVHHAGTRIVINPGAAGPRRFKLKPGVALLRIEHSRAAVQLVTL
ncbi:MAG TPA: metallophosphoesterase family protein [Vicinamibacterales bacterium]|nr:metallophosphoesterase family protein [Vicinamibacterales bacterium]